MKTRTLTTALLCAVLAVLAACGGEDGVSPPSGKPPNVLLVVVDTLRQDALGCYGHGRARTPALDALAREGVLFTDARSSSPWTLPAHASLFASLFPDQHGAVVQTRQLPEGFTTVAEVLRDAGWRTVAFTDGGFVTESFGVLQGFEIVGAATGAREDKQIGMGVEFIADQTWQWIERHVREDPERPFFMFCHTYEVHGPYAPDQRFRDLLVRPYSGTLSAAVDVDDLKARVLAGTITEDDRRYARDLYDAEVAYTDEQLGVLFGRLRDAGILDETLVVVTSDHGEEFGEHLSYGHRNVLYDTLLRVPLIVRHPSLYTGGRRVASPVRLEDIAPTILEVAGLVSPPEWIGKSLSDPDAPRDVLSSNTPEQPDRDPEDWAEYPTARAVCADGRKWTWYPDRYMLLPMPVHEVFDLRRDPGERFNLFSPVATEEVEACIEAVRQRYPDHTGGAGARADMTEQEKEALRGLGYVK